jgi:hypothetical protein
MSSTMNIEDSFEMPVEVVDVTEVVDVVGAKPSKSLKLPEKFNKLMIFEFWMINKMIETNSVLDLAGLVNRSNLPVEEQIAFYTKYEDECKEETKKYKNYMKEISKPKKEKKEPKPKRVVEVMYADTPNALVEELTKCALKVDVKEKVVKEKVVKEKVVKEKVVKEKVVKEKVVKEKVVKEKKNKVVSEVGSANLIESATADSFEPVENPVSEVGSANLIESATADSFEPVENPVSEPAENIVILPTVEKKEKVVKTEKPKTEKTKTEKTKTEKTKTEKTKTEKTKTEKTKTEKTETEKAETEKTDKKEKAEKAAKALTRAPHPMTEELVKSTEPVTVEKVDLTNVEFIEDEEFDDDDEMIETTEIIIDGTLYLKGDNDRIYDRDTEQYIGTHNISSNTIEAAWSWISQN